MANYYDKQLQKIVDDKSDNHITIKVNKGNIETHNLTLNLESIDSIKAFLNIVKEDLEKEEKEIKPNIHYPNKEDYITGFYKNNYRIWLTAHGIEYIVNADCTQEALDSVMDYNVDNGKIGLYWSDDETEELTQDGFISDYTQAGNEGKYFSTHNIRIEKI